MTVLAIVIETVQLVPEMLWQPDQDLNSASDAGVAVRVTVAPFATCALHVPVDPVVQEIPAPSIVPLPVTTVVSV